VQVGEVVWRDVSRPFTLKGSQQQWKTRKTQQNAAVRVAVAGFRLLSSLPLDKSIKEGLLR